MGEPFNSNMQMRLTINNAIRNLKKIKFVFYIE